MKKLMKKNDFLCPNLNCECLMQKKFAMWCGLDGDCLQCNEHPRSDTCMNKCFWSSCQSAYGGVCQLLGLHNTLLYVLIPSACTSNAHVCVLPCY